ncbi:flagellar hook-length control protein FliK [Sulfuricurvum sp.]|uniref:flagellar hook-length control protein FliK n=1 Tax=Sulfuricurvum sp. TaxID=2025608 RepID=UPI003BAE4980
MIIQSKETKGQASLIELLGGTQKKSSTKSNDMFSKLLLSLTADKNNPKTDLTKALVTNSNEKAETSKTLNPRTDSSKSFTTVIDPKKAQDKSSLQQLLSGNDQPQENTPENTLFSKVLLEGLSSDQVRTMINRAKDYLKNEIASKAPEYKADPKTLPKTLLGLVQLADKMGLNPQSITLSTLFTQPSEQTVFTPELLSKPLLEMKALTTAPVTATPSSPTSEAISQLLSEIKSKENGSKSAPKSEVAATNSKNDVFKAEMKGDVLRKESEHKQPLSALLQTLDKSAEVPAADLSTKDISSKPAEAKVNVSAKTDGLISLLKGEPPKEEEIKSGSNTKNDADMTKTHQAPKADALEVKTKEAAQSMRYFATDLKEAVDSYKPPFTRLSMTLNPEKLGEVEVTLVQRGNNVHVNIQSANTNSVAFLAHNATELKAQLASQGISNATMNFMSGGDGQNQNPGQQQQNQQQQQNRFRAYESLKDIELNGEHLSALEIIIPHYA